MSKFSVLKLHVTHILVNVPVLYL